MLNVVGVGWLGRIACMSVVVENLDTSVVYVENGHCDGSYLNSSCTHYQSQCAVVDLAYSPRIFQSFSDWSQCDCHFVSIT